jgi:hypothetical protein
MPCDICSRCFFRGLSFSRWARSAKAFCACFYSSPSSAGFPRRFGRLSRLEATTPTSEPTGSSTQFHEIIQHQQHAIPAVSDPARHDQNSGTGRSSTFQETLLHRLHRPLFRGGKGHRPGARPGPALFRCRFGSPAAERITSPPIDLAARPRAGCPSRRNRHKFSSASTNRDHLWHHRLSSLVSKPPATVHQRRDGGRSHPTARHRSEFPVEKIAGRAPETVEPHHRQHVASVELVEQPGVLRPVGLRAAHHFAEDFFSAGGGQRRDL